jgi:hypothetical protein
MFTFRYQAKPDVTSMARAPQDDPHAAVGRWFRNTAELSGELSVGDVVVVGEVALAVGRPAGWEPVSGSVNEVRTCEHGTRPLPVSAEPGEPVPEIPREGVSR